MQSDCFFMLVPDNDLEAVTQALVVHKELTQEEAGCIAFRVTQRMLQPNRFEFMKSLRIDQHLKPTNSE